MTLALLILAVALLLSCVCTTVLALQVRGRGALPGPRLTGRTVIVERPGPDVVNLRGIVLAQHADRLTLGETQAIGPDGDVPLETPIVHIPPTQILSVSEIAATA